MSKASISKTRKLTFILTLVFMCLTPVSAKNITGRSPAKEIKVPASISYQVLSYGESAEPRANQLGVAYEKSSNELKPTVVFIHGGGWTKGDKDESAWQAIQVAKKGFVGITLSYQLVSEASFPACIEDVKQAIRYIKSLSPDIPIDTNRIGLWGYSAGAHLALMAAISPDKVFHSGKYKQYTSSVKAVMAVSAPTNFPKRMDKETGLKIFSKQQSESLAFLNAISPLTYINKNQIPVTLLHGSDDPLVKPYHYLDFKQRSEELGVKNFKLYEAKGGGHMFYFKRKGFVKPIFKDFINSL